jgi:pimeloyl-ACP methyl ester carboxylesterase
MSKKIIPTTTCLILLVFLVNTVPAAARSSQDADRYTATTADGIDLAIKHYRPDRTARFNRAAQPILMLPGLESSMNEFDTRTPPGENWKVTLPSPLASWAKGDKYIQKDHMRYYSMAHFLWLQGYDVWMANYRGEGREPYLSGGVTGYSIDDLGIYDAPALVERIYELTGKHPIWFGHSLGSTIAYIYLQGSKYGEGDNPHVVSDPNLVMERNNGDGPQSIKALIDMDGPMVPFTGYLLDNPISWAALWWPWYIDLRPLLTQYGEYIADPLISMGDMLWDWFKALGLPDLQYLNTLLMTNKGNTDPSVGIYGIKYCFDGLSTRCLAQFADAAAHQEFRENFYHGNYDMIPPDPAPDDGYYVYNDKDNLKKISIPALVLADDRQDITNPDDIKNFYLGKSRTSLDQFMRVPGCAHTDIVCGLNAPTVTYPTIGKWLKVFMATNKN